MSHHDHKCVSTLPMCQCTCVASVVKVMRHALAHTVWIGGRLLSIFTVGGACFVADAAPIELPKIASSVNQAATFNATT